MVIIYVSYPIVHLGKKIEKKFIFDIRTKYNPLCIYSTESAGINLYENFHK